MNDIEKKLRKRGMAKLDKYAKNPYKVPKLPWYKRIPLWTKVIVPTAVLTTALFVVVISSFSIDMFTPKGRQNDSTSRSPQTSIPTSASQGGSKTPTTSAPRTPTSEVTPGERGVTWRSLPIYKKFPSFSYEGINYKTVSDYADVNTIDYKLDDVVLTAVDDIGVDRSIDAGIFTLKYSSYDSYVALRFSNDNHYYMYCNVNIL